MYSTICGECFNDIPVAYGDCPYCKIAAHEQTRLRVEGHGPEDLRDHNGEDCPIPHELIIRNRTSAVLSLLCGAGLSSLILFFSMPTPPGSLGNPPGLRSWAATDEESEPARKRWSNETDAALKEANSRFPQQQTTR